MTRFNRFTLSAIMISFSTIFSCSVYAGPCVFPFTKDEAPNWICNDDPTSFPGYIYVASGSRVRSKMKGSLTRNLAIMDARNNLARAVSTDIAARLRMHIEELTDGELTWGNSIADETAFNFTHEILNDTIVIDTIGGSDDIYYVLVGMRSAAAKKAIKSAVLSTLNDARADHIRNIGQKNFDQLTQLVANDGFVPKEKPKTLVDNSGDKKSMYSTAPEKNTTPNNGESDYQRNSSTETQKNEPASKPSFYSRAKVNAKEVAKDVKDIFSGNKECSGNHN